MGVDFLSQQLCSPQNVNCRDLEGRHSTPLHFAAGYNRVSVVEYLLHHGADVHAKDKGYIFILWYTLIVFYEREISTSSLCFGLNFSNCHFFLFKSFCFFLLRKKVGVVFRDIVQWVVVVNGWTWMIVEVFSNLKWSYDSSALFLTLIVWSQWAIKLIITFWQSHSLSQIWQCNPCSFSSSPCLFQRFCSV